MEHSHIHRDPRVRVPFGKQEGWDSFVIFIILDFKTISKDFLLRHSCTFLFVKSETKQNKTQRQ